MKVGDDVRIRDGTRCALTYWGRPGTILATGDGRPQRQRLQNVFLVQLRKADGKKYQDVDCRRAHRLWFRPEDLEALP